jgi:hypothetical protein
MLKGGNGQTEPLRLLIKNEKQLKGVKNCDKSIC